MAFTKVVGPGIHTQSQLRTHNIHSSGIITATKFIGPLEASSGSSGTFDSLTVTGNVSVGGTLQYEDVTNVDSVGVITARAGINISGGTATFAGGVGIADSIFHIGDTDTAIRFPAADTFAVETAGDERLRIDSTGFVGINTTDPEEFLDVVHTKVDQTPGSDDIAVFRKTGSGYLKVFSNTSGMGGIAFGDTDDTFIGALQYNHSDNSMRAYVNNDERLRITSEGKLGIGITNPGAELHAYHATSNTIAQFESGDASAVVVLKDNSTYSSIDQNGTDFIIHADPGASHANSALSFKVDGDEKLRITSDGKVKIDVPTSKIGITTGNLDVWGDATLYPTLRLGSLDLNEEGEHIRFGRKDIGSADIRYHSIWGRSSATEADNYLAFKLHNGSGSPYTGQTEVLRLEGDGKVGIGTDNPSQTLTIFGASSSGLRISKSGVLAYDHTFDGSTYEIKNNNGSAGIPLIIGTKTSGGESLRITAAGKVGIGTDNPDGNLHVHNSTAGSVTAAGDANELVLESAANVGMSFLTANDSLSRIKFADPDATNAGIIIYSHADDSFRFQHTSNERLRIKSDGDIRAGDSANTWAGDRLEVAGAKEGVLGLANYGSTASEAATINFYRSISGTIGNDTVPTDGIGEIRFRGWSGDAYQVCAKILASADGTWNSSGDNTDTPGRLTFHTTPDGSSTVEERFRIDSDGKVGIGTNNPSTYKLHLQGSTSALARFERTGGGFAKVDIKAGNNTGNSYLTFSDTDESERGEIFYEHSDDSLRFGTAGTANRMKIDSDGYVTKPNTPYFHVQASPEITNSPYDNGVKTFDHIRVNNGSHYNNTTGVFTAPVAGFYFFSAGLWSSNSDANNGDTYALLIRRDSNGNNGIQFAGANHHDQWGQLVMAAGYYCALGDQIYVFYNGSIQNSTPRNYFSGCLIG